MSIPESHSPILLEIPETRRGGTGLKVLAAGVVLVGALGIGVWRTGLTPSTLFAAQDVALATLPVDEGEMVVVVTENGSLESANNAQVRAKVEALIGKTGGGLQGAGGNAAGGGGGRGGAGGGGGGGAGQGGAGGMGGQGGAGGAGGQAAQPAPVAKKAGAVKARPGSRAAPPAKTSSSSSATTTAAAGGAATTAAGGTATASAGGGGGGAGGAGAAASTGSATTPAKKPMIRSFTYMVVPHVPLRPKTVAVQPVQQQVDPMMMGGGRGGRGGGRGGAGGMGMEKPGATRIISIVPEGKKVKPGEVIIELDSSAFRTELQAQEIRYAQAKAWVEQAAAILDVNLITQREYREGIFPQDVQLVRQYLVSCRTDEERARKNYEWAVGVEKKGLRSAEQTQADELSWKQSKFALSEAEGMAVRLDKYSGPKIIKNLEAKIEAIRADKLAQESAFQLESDRLRRLRETVENCTIRAPRDGIVVYYTPPNMWGRTEDRVQEGVTVREGQILVELPDPKNMRVRARVNESKVALIHPGQRAEITLDAFPGQTMPGTVGDITPIPAPANGPISDVKIYFATVNIDPGTAIEGLRPGLSAEVKFLVKAPKKVTRVPIGAIRWVNNKPFAAVPIAVTGASKSGEPTWQWKSVALGETNTGFAEVVSGLKPGDRVIARPDLLLPAPRPERPAGKAPVPAVAGNSPRPAG